MATDSFIALFLIQLLIEEPKDVSVLQAAGKQSKAMRKSATPASGAKQKSSPISDLVVTRRLSGTVLEVKKMTPTSQAFPKAASSPAADTPAQKRPHGAAGTPSSKETSSTAPRSSEGSQVAEQSELHFSLARSCTALFRSFLEICGVCCHPIAYIELKKPTSWLSISALATFRVLDNYKHTLIV